MKPVILIGLLTAVSMSTHANFASWSRNSTVVSEKTSQSEATQTEVDNSKTTSSDLKKHQPQQTRSGSAQQAEQTRNIRTTQQNEQKTSIESARPAPLPSYQAQPQSQQVKTENISESDEYALKMLKIGTTPNKLSSMQDFALNRLNSALILAGINAADGVKNSTTLNELAVAIGCVNSQGSENLNKLALGILREHQVNSPKSSITSIINSSPQIGGSHKADCF